MEIVEIIGIGFITALSALLLKTVKPELSFVVTVVGSIVLLLFSLNLLKDSFAFFQKLGELSSLGGEVLKIILKIVGIGYLTEFAAGVLSDFGAGTVAEKVVFGGKVVILLLTIPILENLLELMLSLLSFV